MSSISLTLPISFFGLTNESENSIRSLFKNYLKFVIPNYHVCEHDICSSLILSVLSDYKAFPKNLSAKCITDKESSVNSDISVMYANVRSLLNKMFLFRQYVYEFKPKIIFLTETWCHPELSDNFLNLINYVFFRCDRQNGKGGGVLIYVHNTLAASFENSYSIDDNEIVCCSLLNADNSTTGIVCVYRPPHSDIDNLFELLSDYIVNKSHNHFCIVGDFNCPDVRWNDDDFVSLSSPIIE